MSTRILVTGATGSQGGAVVKNLLSLPNLKSLAICALTRYINSPSAQKLASRGVELIEGDLNVPSSLYTALKGVHHAYLVTDDKEGLEKETQKGLAFISAAQQAGVRHIVFSSIDGAERQSGVPRFESKFAIEMALKESGIGYTILRPVAFMDNFPVEPGFTRFAALGFFNAAVAGETIQFIAVDDIGYFAAQALLNPKEYHKEELTLAGDELSVSQVCEVYGKVQGSTAWKIYLPHFLPSKILPVPFQEMLEYYIRTGFGKADIPALRKRHPDLLSFEGYIRKH